LKYFKTIGSDGGLFALFVDNKKKTSRVLLLDLFIDGQVFIVDVVDLDIELVAHINSRSYSEGSRNTPEKRTTFNTWHNAMRIQR
jgi:hypothetical protein